MAKPKKSKRFKYNLESVLKVRRIEETQAKERLREADEKLKEEIKKEEEIKQRQVDAYTELRELMSGGSTMEDLNDIIRRKAYLDKLQEQVEEQIKVREEAEKERDEKREELLQAVRNKKIMEKDKEKKRLAWFQLMKKEDNKFMDDISSVGYVRKKGLEAEDEKTT